MRSLKKTSSKNLVLLIFTIIIFNKVNAQEKNLKPNVLFIVCDDLNDYEGAFSGHKNTKTPNIDKLAASGIKFINAQTNVPVCSPSRNSFMTGVYPYVSKDFGWTDPRKQPILKNNKTIVDLLRENNYYTLGTGKISHYDLTKSWDEWGNDVKYNYGPIYYNGEKTTAHPKVPEPFRSIGAIDGSFGSLATVGISEGIRGSKGWVYGQDLKPMRYIDDDHRDPLQDELHTMWATKRLKELAEQPLQKPFFMGIGFVRPHTPMHVPQKYYDMFPINQIQLDKWLKTDTSDTYYEENFDESKDNKGPKYYKQILASYGQDHEKAIKQFLQAYLACVAFIDEQIGKVLDELERSGLAKNTIVILTSDHGYQLGEKNYLFKNSPWEESTRIPFIIKTPNCKPGIRIEQPISLIDLFPTIMDYCKLTGNNKKNEQGANLGGHSLRPLIEGKKEWTGPHGALTMVGNYGVDMPTEKQNFSYRTVRWRYIRYSNQKEELYDHSTDPYEWKNLANINSYQVIKKQLSDEVNELLKIQ